MSSARQSREGIEPAWRTEIMDLVGVIQSHGDIAEMEPKQLKDTEFEREVALLDKYVTYVYRTSLLRVLGLFFWRLSLSGVPLLNNVRCVCFRIRGGWSVVAMLTGPA
jgi:hypothetical protein